MLAFPNVAGGHHPGLLSFRTQKNLPIYVFEILFLEHWMKYLDLICLVSMVIAVIRIYLISFYLFVLLILLGSSICILSIFCVSKKLLLNLFVGSMAFGSIIIIL